LGKSKEPAGQTRVVGGKRVVDWRAVTNSEELSMIFRRFRSSLILDSLLYVISVLVNSFDRPGKKVVMSVVEAEEPKRV
jgi:hypothetical protein